MDRWEIGGLVVPDIFLPVVDSVRKYEAQAPSKVDFSEVLRSASVFFDGVESGLIWGEIVGLIVQAIGAGKLSPAERVDKLTLVNFIISHFNVREEEMLLVHAPLATLSILTMLEDIKEKAQRSASDLGTSEEVSKFALTTAMSLIDLVPERAFQTRPSTSQSMATTFDGQSIRNLPNPEVIQRVRTFYVQDQGNLDAVPPPYSFSEVSELLLREAGNITCQSLSSPVSSADAGIKAKLLVMMLSKMPKATSLNVSKLQSSIAKTLATTSRIPFLVLSSITSLSASLFSASYITSSEISAIVGPLVRQAWKYLSASQPKYHVESARCLWQLQMTLSVANHEIEAAICSLMVENDDNGTFAIRDADPGRSFSILWSHTLQDNANHLDRRSSKVSNNEAKGSARLPAGANYEVMLTRPLFLLLDALLDERTQLFMTVRTWLQNLVGIDKYVFDQCGLRHSANGRRLFHIFVSKFSVFAFLQTLPDKTSNSSDSNIQAFGIEDDLDQCVYYLRTLSNMLRWASDSMWAALAENSISTDTNHPALNRISMLT